MHQQIAANAYHAILQNDADGVRQAIRDACYMQEVEGADAGACVAVDRAAALALRAINASAQRNRDATAIDIDEALSALARLTRV